MYDPAKHHRRSIRLQGYDYAQAGAYFVTICTLKRECLLGEVVREEMRLSPWGEMARDEWLRSAVARGNVELDAFVVMPNHLHGIIRLTDPVGATRWVALARESAPRHPLATDPPGATRRVAPTGPPRGSIGAIIGQFKSAAAKRINESRRTPGEPIWQRNYYEHIIRNEDSLYAIRLYVDNNLPLWSLDPDNAQATGWFGQMDQTLLRRCGFTRKQLDIVARFEANYRQGA